MAVNTHAEWAAEILPLIGGKDNVASAAHCATRLRLVLKDNEKADKEALDKLDYVKGVFLNGGQFQIILGQGVVNKVYAELIKLCGITEMSTEEVKSAGAEKLNPAQKLAKLLSDIFVPIIPAIVASGLLMGIMGLCSKFGISGEGTWWWTLLDMFSGAALAVYFKTKNKKMKAISLPAAISCTMGITEAAIFGVNLRYRKPFMGAAIGGAAAGAYVVATQVKMTAVGVTALPAIAITTADTMINYIIGLVIAGGVAFAATLIMGIKEEA